MVSMAAAASKSPWTKKTLPRVLLIIGVESALREEALAAVRAAAFGEGEAANQVVLHGPASANEATTLTPADILDEACTASMFAADDELKLVIVRQADYFLGDKDWREILERNVEKIPATATLIFEAATFGQLKSTRFYKALVAAKAVIECESLAGKYGDSPELSNEVDRRARAKGLNLGHGALLRLLAKSAKNLGIIEEELDKLVLALQPEPGKPVTVKEEHVDEFCASTATFTGFNFVDAVLDRNAKRALEVLGGIFERGIADQKPGKVITNESSITMLILGALTWKLSQLQDAQAGLDLGKSEREAFGAAKIPPAPFLMDAARKTLKKHSGVSLRRSMDALYRANLDLRLGGRDPRDVLEQLVWKIVKS
jgi:DNA polymerase III delta subunit